MTVNPGNNTTILPPAIGKTAAAPVYSTESEQSMQKDMFLKLMIAQLRNQDPTAPMDQKDMMASMTQYSQVEQMQNITRAMETLSLAQGVGMVGKNIEYDYVLRNEEGTTIVDEIRLGKVVSVEQKAGEINLVLANGVRVKPSNVTSISELGRSPQTLLGRYVDFEYTGTNAAGESVTVNLTGKVNSLSGEGADAKLVINGRLIDADAVFAVSKHPKTTLPANPPSGVV